jgi:hypothetical protein
MPLPGTVRVKLSSEAAGAVSFTPVVVRELALRELLEHVLGVVGKNEPRIREILLRGTLVSGASRFRWTGWEPDPAGLHQLLDSFPDPDPSRVFDKERCARAILRGGRQPIEISREGLFWDLLMEVAGEAGMQYGGYSYRDRADRYLRPFSVGETERLRAGSGTVRYSALREQIRSAGFREAELYVTR